MLDWSLLIFAANSKQNNCEMVNFECARRSTIQQAEYVGLLNVGIFQADFNYDQRVDGNWRTAFVATKCTSCCPTSRVSTIFPR
jgi:hypothetical protein